MHIHEQAPVTRTEPLDQELLGRIDAYWRAANYLSVGQVYLLDNPLLKVPLTLAHIKPRLPGHWGTTPGLNFIYVHLNDLDRIHLAMDAIDRLPATGAAGVLMKQRLGTRLVEHRRYIELHGEDMPEIMTWRWTAPSSEGGS